MDELEKLTEKLRLISESLWYIKWAMVFMVASLITDVVTLVTIFTGNTRGAFITSSLSLVLIGVSVHLGKKSQKYYRQARGDE